jgi:galactokinase
MVSFGGCTINLVEAEAAEEFCASVAEKYRTARGITPDVYICSAAAGAGPA